MLEEEAEEHAEAELLEPEQLDEAGLELQLLVLAVLEFLLLAEEVADEPDVAVDGGDAVDGDDAVGDGVVEVVGAIMIGEGR